MDRLSKMTSFVRVVETGSFTAAARLLRVSPTMVSKHVRELEEQLDIKLLNRTTRRVSLTEVGMAFYERCAPLLKELAELESMASRMHATPRGTLRVGAPPTFGAARLAPVLADFCRRYPEVEVELLLTDRAADLIEDGLDLALRTGDIPDSSCMTRLLTVFTTILCASPDYLREHGTPCRPADLAAHNCLPLSVHGLTRQWHFTGPDQQGHAVAISGNIRTNSPAAQLAAALRGHGLTLQPSYLVGDHIRDGRLVRVLPDYQGPDIPLRLIYLPGHNMAAKIRAFIDFLCESFAGQDEASVVLPVTL